MYLPPSSFGRGDHSRDVIAPEWIEGREREGRDVRVAEEEEEVVVVEEEEEERYMNSRSPFSSPIARVFPPSTVPSAPFVVSLTSPSAPPSHGPNLTTLTLAPNSTVCS